MTTGARRRVPADTSVSCRIGYIVNVTKEVDNFYPSLFYYMKIRVSDEESAELLKHWEGIYRLIRQAE